MRTAETAQAAEAERTTRARVGTTTERPTRADVDVAAVDLRTKCDIPLIIVV